VFGSRYGIIIPHSGVMKNEIYNTFVSKPNKHPVILYM